MLQVHREIMIAGASSETVFFALSNPEGLTRLMPRLRKANIEDEHERHARLTLCISIGNMFGTVCFAGNLEWDEPEQIMFDVSKPLNATIQWTLTPDDEGSGTHLAVDAALNLAPLLGPMVHFVPQDLVKEIIGKELEHALNEIADRLDTLHHADMAVQESPTLILQPVVVTC